MQWSGVQSPGVIFRREVSSCHTAIFSLHVWLDKRNEYYTTNAVTQLACLSGLSC